MLTYDQIQTAVYQWMIENVGIDNAADKVRADNINFTQPPMPFVVYQISAVRRVGQDYISMADVDGNVNILGDREFTLMITAVGDEAFDILFGLRDSLQKISVQTRLNDLGLVYFDDEPIQDITEDVNTGRQTRASLDVFFRLGHAATDQTGFIETVIAESEIKESSDVVVDDNIVIN